ncbi:class I SAM-dependent methyltransferase [Nemorincola caseinilytica]|uniref:Class I SAM-dependent methyltransferase n=1 Tax=Nemorincola caseinilytica TaxID=2054315 RepID=A0ABP8NI41_9BACT
MNTSPQDHVAVNRKLWDEKTPFHIASAFYRNDAFKAGASTLKDIELALLGDMAGKRILHLQCHFGQDSLSLARMGAIVTGVDLSGAAITYARQLNDELGLNASFICADVYELPQELLGQFDIVFSSYGTIVWLPDMPRWAGSIARCLAPGGRFVFAETHPLVLMYDDNFKGIIYPYFNTGTIHETEQGTYADRSADISLPSMTWNHTLSDVIGALLGAGLTLTAFHEFDHCPYDCFGNMVQVAPGKYQVKGQEGMFPLVYSLAAQKAL